MNAKKKLLIAGGGYADIPQIIAAKNLGYHVITSGNRSNELGHSISDEYQYADFSNVDEILDLAKKLKVNAICPSCNDFSAISCAYTAEKLCLPGYDSYETTLTLHHKDKYRQFASDNDIPTPKALGFDDIDSALLGIEAFNYPVMIKPTDLTGGKGIRKVTNYNDAYQAISDAFSISKSNRVVIEEFIDGTRHGFSALLKDKKICFSFADNEYYYLNDYMVSAASTPTITDESLLNNLTAQSEKIASLLSLADGVFHIQYINNKQQPTIIEICRRPPGDLYTKFVQIATNIDYPREILKPYLNYPLSRKIIAPAKGYFTRHCIMSSRNGYVKNVSYNDKIKDNIIQEFLFWSPNYKIDSYLTNKLGIIFLKFNSKNEMLEITADLNNLINIEFS